MIRALDHIVIVAQDLHVAIASYAAAGFTVAPGGTHADGATHNALIVFADDTYIELIAFLREAPAHPWWRHVAAGEGLIDFALLPDPIEADVAAARARGLAIDGPNDGGRLRPDGVRVAWKTARPAAPGLPFLCADVTPRELRVPTGALRQHANGASGIARVTVAAADVWETAANYAALLGTAVAAEAYAVGAATIALSGPQPGALEAQLARRGAGPFALALRGSRTATLSPALTHGVPIELVRA